MSIITSITIISGKIYHPTKADIRIGLDAAALTSVPSCGGAVL